ncbi:MAG: hypothetical protein AAF465_03095 [Pseudomonadota bacterium]
MRIQIHLLVMMGFMLSVRALADNPCSITFSEVADIPVGDVVIHQIDVTAAFEPNRKGVSYYSHDVSIHFSGLGLPRENILSFRGAVSMDGVISEGDSSAKVKSVFAYGKLVMPFAQDNIGDRSGGDYRLAYPGKGLFAKTHERGVVRANSPTRKNRQKESEPSYLELAIGMHSQGFAIYYAFLAAIFGEDSRDFLKNGDRAEFFGKKLDPSKFSLTLTGPLNDIGANGDITGFLGGYSNNSALLNLLSLSDFYAYLNKARSGGCGVVD